MTEAEVKYEYIFVPTTDQAKIDSIKRFFRAVRERGECTVINEQGEPVKGMRLQCFEGSSRYDTKEMTQLIDVILDKLARMDIHVDDVGEYQYLLNERRRAKP